MNPKVVHTSVVADGDFSIEVEVSDVADGGCSRTRRLARDGRRFSGRSRGAEAKEAGGAELDTLEGPEVEEVAVVEPSELHVDEEDTSVWLRDENAQDEVATDEWVDVGRAVSSRRRG